MDILCERHLWTAPRPRVSPSEACHQSRNKAEYRGNSLILRHLDQESQDDCKL